MRASVLSEDGCFLFVRNLPAGTGRLGYKDGLNAARVSVEFIQGLAALYALLAETGLSERAGHSDKK